MKQESIIGVDLGGTTVDSGLIKNSNIEKIFSLNISAEKSELDILEQVIQTIENVYVESVAGIGIGVPGLINVEKGIVYNLQNIPSWQEVHLKEKLENHFGVPVYVNNDANCLAAGVKYFGIGKESRNLAGLALGTGMGTGVIIDGKLYSGSHGGAGEFGMIPYRDHNYEYYCSGQFFKTEYEISGKDLYNKAKKDDKKALRIFEIFGGHLGKAITAILYAFDPEMIVLGGSVSKAYWFFKKSMQREIDAFKFTPVLDRFTIKVNKIPNIAVLGAAALYLDSKKRA